MKKHRLTVAIGDEVYIKVARGDEYSTYRVKVTVNDFMGDGLDDVFLKETTGFTEDGQA